MPLLHARFLEPEALREHLRAAPEPALADTADTGPLDDEAAAALASVIFRAGEPGGVLDLEGADPWEPRFLLIASLALGDDALAWQLLEGGWLDRRGIGAFAFGALPLRVVARQVSRESLRAAREAVQYGWESELLMVLESAGLRAERAPEEHLVLLRRGAQPLPLPSRSSAPSSRSGASSSRSGASSSRSGASSSRSGASSSRSGRAESRPSAPSLATLLHEARAQGATDLSLTVGLPPMLHGAFGSRALGETVLTGSMLTALVNPIVPTALLGSRGPIVHTLSNADVGRFRVTVTTERTQRAAAFRVLPDEVPTLDGLGLSPLVQGPLLRQARGLVLISGEPGSGRSTLYGALLQRLVHEGRHVASLEEPLGLPLEPGPGAARQAIMGVDCEALDFARATRLQPLDVVGFDLVDDAQGLDLALEASMDGRLAVCVFRAASVASAIHRATVLDARHHRRRVAEGLAAFMFQRLKVIDGKHHLEVDFHLPSVALRRHLRAHETPPPPIVFEEENVG